MYALNRARRWWRTKTVWRILPHIIDNARQIFNARRLPAAGTRLATGRSGKRFFKRRSGYSDVETCRDYGGNERVTCGRFTPWAIAMLLTLHLITMLRSPSVVCRSLLVAIAAIYVGRRAD